MDFISGVLEDQILVALVHNAATLSIGEENQVVISETIDIFRESRIYVQD